MLHHYPFGHRKIFEVSMAMRIRWYIDWKLITSPCKFFCFMHNFTNDFKILFFQYACLYELHRFSLRQSHITAYCTLYLVYSGLFYGRKCLPNIFCAVICGCSQVALTIGFWQKVILCLFSSTDLFKYLVLFSE